MNTTGNTRACLDNMSALVLAGGIERQTTSTLPSPPDGYFVVRDDANNPVAWIDSTTGNIRTKGELYLHQALLTRSSNDAFRFVDDNGTVVCIITKMGDMYLTGGLFTQSSP